MEKLLSQAEIDALFRAAQGETAGAGSATPSAVVEPWDLGHTGLLGKEQLHSLEQLCEGFARNLTSAAGVQLGDRFDVALVAIEQLSYRDFLARTAEVTYYATFRLPPGDVRGILHLDLGLAFPIVDLLLGGAGAMPSGAREVTQIEEALLEGVGHVICHELRLVLQALELEVEFEQRQPAAQMLRLMPPEEKTLALAFDVTMAESKGTLNIVFPSGISSALLRRMRAEVVYRHAHGPAVHQQSIGARLLESQVRLELATPEIPLAVSELLALRPGVVLPLDRRIEEPALLGISGRPRWSARPVSSRNARAAQLLTEIATGAEEKTA